MFPNEFWCFQIPALSPTYPKVVPNWWHQLMSHPQELMNPLHVRKLPNVGVNVFFNHKFSQTNDDVDPILFLLHELLLAWVSIASYPSNNKLSVIEDKKKHMYRMLDKIDVFQHVEWFLLAFAVESPTSELNMFQVSSRIMISSFITWVQI